MTDPLEIIAGGIGVIFGAGAAWGALNASLKATKLRAETAVEEGARAIALVATLRTELAELRGAFQTHVAIVSTRESERRSQVSQSWLEDRLEAQDAFLTAIAKKTGSTPAMIAARVSQRDIPRQDSEPPLPEMRPRLPSRRG